MKQDAVLLHGGEFVAIYIHAYDKLQVMVGQGTLANEIVLMTAQRCGKLGVKTSSW